MSYRHGWVMSDERAEELVSEAHVDCLVCGTDGCAGCPSAFCDRTKLVEHAGEHMCAECVPAFEALTDNREVA